MNGFISVEVGCLSMTFYKTSPTGDRACKVQSDLLVLNSSLIINAIVLFLWFYATSRAFYGWSAEKVAYYFVGSPPFFPFAVTTLLMVKNMWITDRLFLYMLCCHISTRTCILTSYGREVICWILKVFKGCKALLYKDEVWTVKTFWEVRIF